MHNAIKNNLKYISLALCAFFFAYQYGIKSVIPSVLNEELRQYFSINASQMGSLMGLSMAAYTLMQLIAGPIVDRFQAKKVFSIAFSIMSISGAVFLLQNDFLIAQVSQFIVGCAAAFPFVLIMKVSNEYFDREQVSIASSTAIAIGCAGPVVFNPLLTNLMVIFHWRIVSIAFCLFGLIVAVCSLFFMQNETKNEVSGTIAEENDKSHDRTPLQGIKLLLNPQFLLCGLFGGAVLGSSATFFDAWGLVFLKTVYGFDSKQASYFISVGYIGVILGMPLIALWAKHIQSYKKVMLICVVLLAITLSMLVFIKMPNYALGIVLFSISILASCEFLAFTSVLNWVPKNISGTASGILNTIVMGGETILVYGMGKFLDLYKIGNTYTDYSYRQSAYLLLISVAIATVCVFFIKDTYKIQQKRINEKGA